MLIFSCKKDKGSSCTISMASISGSYKKTAVTYKASATSAEVDYFSTVFPDACEWDDINTFDTNGTSHLTDAGIVCSPPSTDNGTWSLSGNIMTTGGVPFTIESFDCKTLVLSFPNIQVAGDKLKITHTRQ